MGLKGEIKNQKMETTLQAIQQLIQNQKARAGQSGGISKNSECNILTKKASAPGQGVGISSNDGIKPH